MVAYFTEAAEEARYVAESSREETIEILEEKLRQLKMAEFDVKFDGPYTFSAEKKNMNRPGLYCFRHKPSDTIAYWGIAKALNSRLGKHINVFDNNGERLSYGTDSLAAAQMYVLDPNRDNWEIYIQRTVNIDMAAEMEKKWGTIYPSKFNDPKMLGKM